MASLKLQEPAPDFARFGRLIDRWIYFFLDPFGYAAIVLWNRSFYVAVSSQNICCLAPPADMVHEYDASKHG
jgi:hypothetical protein